MVVKQKGFKEYLKDDSSLAEKITYEEFIVKSAALVNKDVKIKKAFNVCKEICDELEKTVE